MKSLVIYSSQTGFTKKYAEWISEASGAECVEFKKARKLKLADYDAERYLPEMARWHGEDIISASCVLQNGEDLFSIQQVGYDYVPESKASVVRDTDENSERNRKLHAQEFKDLQTLEVKDYLRMSKTYPDGSYMYGDIDWKKFYLLHPERKGFDLRIE